MLGLTKIKNHFHKIAVFGSVFVLVFASLPATSSALEITGRSITLSTSLGAATAVDYTLDTDALASTTTPIQSVGVEFCTSLSGGCSTPAGFTSGSSTLASQPSGLGEVTGWTNSTAATGSLRISHSGHSTNPSGVVSIPWSGVDNPTATNTTFYAKITTYSDTAWATPVDTGNVALSTSDDIQVSLDVSETLTFCTGTSITGQNCATISGNQVALGDGDVSTTASDTSVFAASTNATSGYTVTVSGATLTSGSDTITALAGGGASSPGSSQFGINLVANSTPSVGVAVSGTGTASAEANYNSADSFRFNPAATESVASVGAPTNGNTFTVSYIANIAGTTPPGSYTSNLNYVATANF